MSKPLVAIVGRPNVGKSTLFNRIVGRRVAIVEGEPGVTRDRLYAGCQWLDRPFLLIDTGGIDLAPEREVIGQATTRQAELAVAEADVILFVVDARAGVTAGDIDVADILRRARKPVVIVANKVDDAVVEGHAAEFYQLGMGDPVAISAEHGRNIGDLLDRVIGHFADDPQAGGDEDDVVAVAVLGRPNVGKSSLVNALVGHERVIVSDIPGTTRDAIDTQITRDGTSFNLIDTAGIRRQARIDSDIERYSVLRAVRAAERSHVCAIVIDATDGVTEQDQRIAGIPHEAGKGVLIVVNKWDLVEKDSRTMQEFEARIRNDLAYLQYAPIVFISARTGQRVHEVLDVSEYVAQQAALRISTGRFNEVLQEAVHMHQPPSDKGNRLRILYGMQVGVQPPHFVLFVNEPELFHFSYRRYLENRFREAFGFVGSPIVISAKRRGE